MPSRLAAASWRQCSNSPNFEASKLPTPKPGGGARKSNSLLGFTALARPLPRYKSNSLLRSRGTGSTANVISRVLPVVVRSAGPRDRSKELFSTGLKILELESIAAARESGERPDAVVRETGFKLVQPR